MIVLHAVRFDELTCARPSTLPSAARRSRPCARARSPSECARSPVADRSRERRRLRRSRRRHCPHRTPLRPAPPAPPHRRDVRPATLRASGSNSRASSRVTPTFDSIIVGIISASPGRSLRTAIGPMRERCAGDDARVQRAASHVAVHVFLELVEIAERTFRRLQRRAAFAPAAAHTWPIGRRARDPSADSGTAPSSVHRTRCRGNSNRRRRRRMTGTCGSARARH